MTRWSSRCTLYQVSMVGAHFVFWVYALAFSVPIWLSKEIGNTEGIMGLWAAGLGDSSDFDDVKESAFGDGPTWLDAVRGVWVAGMACYLFGVIASFVENCCMSHSTKDYGVSAWFMFIAGSCGAAGIITMAVENEEDDEWGYDYAWGYIVAVAASGLSIILALILLVTKNYGDSDPAKSSRTADYVYAHKQQGMYGPEYNNPGYRGDELPLVSGVPYHHNNHHQQPQTPYGHSPYNNMYRSGPANGHPGSKYDQGSGYYPYGYKDPRPGNRTSIAESADLSNGFTHDIVHAEHSLGRPQPDYGRSQYARGDYFYNGSRPY